MTLVRYQPLNSMEQLRREMIIINTKYPDCFTLLPQ